MGFCSPLNPLGHPGGDITLPNKHHFVFARKIGYPRGNK